jgi:2-keto-3-deoxy-L-fuconate dehydrogenase
VGRLQGKTAVVTGAAHGIGRATALAFAREGASTVWALDLDSPALTELAAQHSAVQVRPVDLTDPAGVAVFAAEAGAVDVLFNCAGIVPRGTVLDCTEEEWAAAFEVNVTSMFRMIRALLPAMLEAGGGSIVNMASAVSSITGVPQRCAYGASKAAVIGLTKAVAADFIRHGIRCNAVAPGTIDTPSFRSRVAASGDPEAALADFVARQPMGRLGTAEEVAALVVHLASAESAYTTGAVHLVDGGMAL